MGEGVTVDTGRLERMRHIRGGGRGFFDQMVNLFLAEASERIRQMSDAVRWGKPAAAAKAARELRATSATFGALRLAELCRELETFGVAGAMTEVRQMLPALEAELAAVSQEMIAELD